MSRRHVETITDHLIVAVSPMLVILMVGSLVFFATHCFYEGNFHGRLRFASGLFVIAAVLISRISIEKGREYASIFAVLLSIASILSMLKYTDIGILFVLPLVGFIWWSTDKLTWDCTVIDEQKDASGEGLLQTIGMDDNEGKPAAIDREATTDKKKSDSQSFWKKWTEHRRRHHTPGVWVIYFGLAAIPLFGLGQMLLPPVSRGVGFLLLCIYVASALSLLMTTSFLQMRRYLIQRRLPFTDQMASIWLGSGGVIIIGLMIVCLLLPRPNTGYSLIESFEKVSSNDRRASRYAVGKDGVADEEVEGIGESEDTEAESDSESGQQKSADANNGSKSGDNGKTKGGDKAESAQKDGADDASQQGDEADRSDDSKRNENGEDEKDSEETGNSSKQPNQQPSDSNDDEDNSDDGKSTQQRSTKTSFSNPLERFSLPSIPKLIYFAIVAAIILFALIRYGHEIGAAMSAFIRDFKEMWRRLFGGKPETRMDAAEEKEVAEEPQRPFSSYQDPFAMGTTDRFTPQQLVNYTFEALQAWANERNCGRSDEQTPLEFASQVGATNKQVGPLARNLAILYNHAAYSPGTLGNESLDHMRNLWSALRGHSNA